MNNEKYKHIIDEVYEKYTDKYIGYDDVPSKELFIHEIKTNKEFSERWKLKIEEKELSFDERFIIQLEKVSYFGQFNFTTEFIENVCNSCNIPTKLITITYNNETMEIYE